MNDGFQFLDIIFIAMVAAFVLLRLRSVLGRRTGHERRRPNPLNRNSTETASDKVVQLADKSEQPDPAAAFADIDDSTLVAGLTQIKVADPSFDHKSFLEGAQSAFEIIVEAFAAGDAKALRPLLDDEVYEPFSRSIREREAAGHTLDTTLVSIDRAEFLEAGMNQHTAYITLRFTSRQINVTRDQDGAIVEGDQREAVEVIDIWTFERDTRARDPNWRLAATRSPN